MIHIDNISKSYDKKTWVLKNVSFEINKGEMIAIMGPSGSGKSTLLSIIGGIDNEYKGNVYFNGKKIEKKAKYLSDFRKNNIGFVLQHLSLIPNRKVYYNIALPLIYGGFSKNTIKSRVNDVSRILHIEDKLNGYPNILSGGEKQRVAIARAVINNPKIILADEPTASLDNNTKNDVVNILKSLNKDGKTIIIVTHDISVAEHCDRIITLS